jgi:membrane protease YdiL (CAAX protease family)
MLIKLVVFADDAGLHEISMALVPILFMYMPIGMCWLRGVDSWDYPLALPALRDRVTWGAALKLNAVVILAITVPWALGYHLYQTTLFHYAFSWGWGLWDVGIPAITIFDVDLFPGLTLGSVVWPLNVPPLIMLIGYHVFFVAIPEEIFYRGYLQTRLDDTFRPKWNILGAKLGWGWILTCFIFALGHSLVAFQWWHFAIFFPSLVFGWMRARTGGIIAGAMFHACSNIGVSILDNLYGVTVVLPP